jgi:hypothetical protein
MAVDQGPVAEPDNSRAQRIASRIAHYVASRLCRPEGRGARFGRRYRQEWPIPPPLEQPADPDRRSEEGSERQFGRRVLCAPGQDQSRTDEAERTERRDFDRDRQARPIQPDPCDARQFDVPEAHPFASAKLSVGKAKDEKRGGHRGGADKGVERQRRHFPPMPEGDVGKAEHEG